jgi:hypothetical protein
LGNFLEGSVAAARHHYLREWLLSTPFDRAQGCGCEMFSYSSDVLAYVPSALVLKMAQI